jgi:hypothetical protein
MNMNSLIIVADASRARLFRTAQTNVAEDPIELVEIDAVEADANPQESGPSNLCLADSSHGDRDLGRFALQLAERVARFAEFHLCNPVIVTAAREVSSALIAELEHRLPNGYIHRVTGDFAGLSPRALMHELQEREACSSLHSRTPGTIEC